MQNNIRLISIDLLVNSSNTNFKPDSISPQPGVSINSIFVSLYLNENLFKCLVTPCIESPSMNISLFYYLDNSFSSLFANLDLPAPTAPIIKIVKNFFRSFDYKIFFNLSYTLLPN